MPNKYTDFDNWNSEYDIPDDPRPQEEVVNYNEEEEINHDILYKEDMVNHLSRLRRIAMDLRKKQNDYWDDYGDTYILEELVDFVLENREDIVGIVKNAKWLAKAKASEWESQFSLYYSTILEFIERTKYAISSYETQIKKLKSMLKGTK